MMTSVQRLGLGVLLLSLVCCTVASKTNAKNGQSLTSWLRSMRAKRQNSLTSDRQWTLADAIPGEPDRDYPILSEIPDTDFSCDGRNEGYYADIGARCQVFRICANTANDTGKGFAFLCPNGTLFNQEFFVCDWYMNVNCQNSENFYNLNENIGKVMNSYSMNQLMTSAREIIMFPQKTPNYKPGSDNDIFNNYPTQLGSPLGINGSPLRGSSNLGQPTSAVGKYPYTGTNNLIGNGGTTLPGGPQRGANGGTVYVNSLGQLSSDRDSGFDPKHSFILKPDKDSEFDLDVRIPSNSFDTLKGIGNSYSFGFTDQNNAPIRGSADLSEPVDPSAFQNDQYLPPHLRGQNRKQIYTYPHDATSQPNNNNQGILPELTGQFNTKLTAQGPTYQAPHVYGPPSVTQSKPAPHALYQQPHIPVQNNGFQQPQNRFQQTKNGFQQPSNGFQQPSNGFQQPSNGFQQPSNGIQPPITQQRLYQQPHQTVRTNGFQQKQPVQSQSSQAIRLYQQPHQTVGQRAQSSAIYQQPISQKPQPFRPQNPQLDRRQYNVQPTNGLQNGRQQSFNGIAQRNDFNNQQPFSNGFRPGQSNVQANGQSNQEYIRNLLKDRNEVHSDKNKLVELIQRLFVPSNSQTRVVNAEVQPSQAQESFSFTYDGQGAASSIQSDYQPSTSYSGYHQHSGTCGHNTGQGF